jgi:beta-RFAP synthase
MSRVVHVRAPSRLHFGLWALADAAGRQFGGVGAMVNRPATRLSIQPATSLKATGQHQERVLVFAEKWAAFHRLTIPQCEIDVQEAAPEHAGLGMGTQLGLSVAAGLNAFVGLPDQSPQELAQSVQRGCRSAVGTYGFVFGGLIVEQGKLPCESISPLDCRIDLPEEWRFVLLRPHGLCGLAGDVEADAFHSLPIVPQSLTDELTAEVRDRLIPAAAIGQFAAFAESLYRYGNLSGQCFAARQGGSYNGPVLTALVERLRALGCIGVGQSSWGPTIFAAAESQDAAERLAAQAQTQLTGDVAAGDAVAAGLDCRIARPCNRGAQIDVVDSLPTAVD